MRAVAAILLAALLPATSGAGEAPLRAGAAAVDVSPTSLPAIVNGGFLAARANTVRDPLFARALVLDDGRMRLAIVVVDSCMMPRELIDLAKGLAHERTGIPADRMLVSATHTHSAPSAMHALGTPPDPDYVAMLPGRIAEAIAQAAENLEPAHVGRGMIDDPEHTHCRRWIRLPGKQIADPFGDLTVRANMHPGYQNPDAVGPSGPVDPGLSLLSVRSPDGRPIALLANYSMHYFGAEPVSADYYGRFSSTVARLIGADDRFVAMMSQGTSGDQMWMDYGAPKSDITLDAYAEAVARKAFEAYRSISYRDHASLAMAQTTITLRRRVPDARRLEWAREIVAAMADRLPATLPEVYAREAIALHEEPERTLTLQAIRIGDLGIAAIPDEVYALTGLKIKARSPLDPTFTIELANGSEGYIPPPEQHALGGYTTWPARTAGLEVQAEPKIVEAVLGLLEDVSGKPRRVPVVPNGPYAEAVLASKPEGYWRLSDMDGTTAADASGHDRRAEFGGRYAFDLDGPASSAFSGEGTANRTVYFAGGWLKVPNIPGGDTGAWTVEMWVWSGLPPGDRVGLPTLQRSGDEIAPAAEPALETRTWHHVVMVRKGRQASREVIVYVDGTPEVHRGGGRLAARPANEAAPDRSGADLFIGRSGEDEGWEGKLDEVALYDRALSADEVAAHFQVSGLARRP